MKDPVQIFGVLLFSAVLLGLAGWVAAWDMGVQREFEAECRQRGGVPFYESFGHYAGRKRCISGQEIRVR